VNDIIARISTASTEQAEGIAEVNRAVGQMDDMTQQNAALVEEAAAAAASLHEQTVNLARAVSVFKIEGVETLAESDEPQSSRSARAARGRTARCAAPALQLPAARARNSAAPPALDLAEGLADPARAGQAETPGHVDRLRNADARPGTTSMPGGAGSSSNGGCASAQPFRARVTPSAWHSLPGPEHSSQRVLGTAARAHHGPGRQAARSRGSAPRRRGPLRGRRSSGTSGCRRSGRHRRAPADRTSRCCVRWGRKRLCEAGIFAVVGLGFDDAAADAVDQHGDADQLARDQVRRCGKIDAGKDG
jgi:hypothetical protein